MCRNKKKKRGKGDRKSKKERERKRERMRGIEEMCPGDAFELFGIEQSFFTEACTEVCPRDFRDRCVSLAYDWAFMTV